MILLRKSLLPNIFLKGLGNCKMKSSSLNSYLRYRLLTFVSIIVAIAATKMSLSNMSSAITHNTVVSFFVYWKLDEIIVVFVVLKVTFSISRKKKLTWGSAKRSVMVACLKLPIRVKLELELSKFIVTAHSRSRFCFFSKHMAKAHPTAWLRRSP